MTFRALNSSDENRLFDYFHQLSPLTKSRFGPHPFDWETIQALCKGEYKDYKCLVGVSPKGSIVAYTVIKKGYLEHEVPRLSKYPITLDNSFDYTLAPSVADDFQSKGIGSLMLDSLFKELAKEKARKVILWGGVQESNEAAVRFYKKHGFVTLGTFLNHGRNLDMMKELYAF